MFSKTYIFKFTFAFFFLPFISFSQSNSELITVSTDSFINSRFDVIEEHIFEGIMKGEVKVLKDDLKTEIPLKDVKASMSDTTTDIDVNTGEPLIQVNTANATEVDQYELRKESGANYISPIYNERKKAWIPFTEIEKYISKEEYRYFTDLFLEKKTRVQYLKLVCMEQNKEYDNSFMSFHHKLTYFLESGQLSAYRDINFNFEMGAPMLRPILHSIDTIIGSSVYSGDGDTVYIPYDVLPTHYKYAYDYAMVNGKLIRDTDFPFAFEPIWADKDVRYSFIHAKYLFWLKAEDLNYFLPQWQRKMILDWEKGITDNYIVDRIFTPMYNFTGDPNEKEYKNAVSELLNGLQSGNIENYILQSFEYESPVAQTKAVLNTIDSALKAKGSYEIYDEIGIQYYWYRKSDSLLEFLSNPIGISLGSSKYKNGAGQFLIYLPEALGVKMNVDLEKIIKGLSEKMKPRQGKFSAVNNALFSGNLKMFPQNLPDGYKTADSLWLDYIPYKIVNDPSKGSDSCYITKLSTKAPTKINDHKNKILIPYGTFVGGNVSNVNSGIFYQAFPPCLECATGYCNENEEIIVPLKYGITNLFSEGRGLVGYNLMEKTARKKKIGYIDLSGAEIIPVSFEDGKDFSSQLAAVKKDGKWGYIDTTGKIVIAFQYDIAGDFYDQSERAAVKWNGKFGMINKKGKAVGKFVFDSILGIWDEVAIVKAGGKYGVMNMKAKLIIDTIYKNISMPNEHSMLAKDINGNSFVFDTKGKMIWSGALNVNSVCGGVMVVENDDEEKKFGSVDISGKTIAPFIYDKVDEYQDGMLLVKIKDKYGYLDMTGKEVIPCKYRSAQPFSAGMAFVEVGDPPLNPYAYIHIRSICIDRTGKQWPTINALDIHPNQNPNQKFDTKFKNGYFKFQVDYRYGYFSHNGREYIYH